MDKRRISDLKDLVKEEITAASNYFDTVRAPAILEKYQIYEADPKYYQKIFSRLANVSDFVSRDVANAVEWAMPSLMKVFTAGASVVSIVPHGPQSSEKAAEINQKLLDFQLQTLNNSTVLFYRWFKDALIAALGIVKAWWYEERETEKREIVLSFPEYQSFMADIQTKSNIKILSVQYLPEQLSVKLVLSIDKSFRSYPKVAPIPPWECLYNPKCLDIHESPFICHRKEVTVDYLRKQARAGIFDPVKTASVIEHLNQEEITDNILKTEVQAKILEYSEPERKGTPGAKTILYEAYLDFDINGDGLLELVIVTMAGDEILRIEENTFGAKPFFGLSPVMEPYQPEGKSYADMIDDIQKSKTAIMRQVLLNLALTNNPRYKVLDGAGVNINDIITNRQVFRMRDLNAVQPMETPQLAPWTFNVVELLEVDKENRTGVTRYSQGLDSESLNRTATGIMKIMEASQQRLALIARIFAETGIRNLFRFMVGLNQRFIKQEQVIRVAGETLQITPDDLQGEFNFVVEPTALIGGQEKQIAAMQQAIDMAPVMLKMGYMSKDGFYNLLVKYYETIGLRAVTKYIDRKPSEVQEYGEPNMEGETGAGGPAGPRAEGPGFVAGPGGLRPGGAEENPAAMEAGGLIGPREGGAGIGGPTL